MVTLYVQYDIEFDWKLDRNIFSVRAIDGEPRPEEGLPRGRREVLWRQEPHPHPRRHLAQHRPPLFEVHLHRGIT